MPYWTAENSINFLICPFENGDKNINSSVGPFNYKYDT